MVPQTTVKRFDLYDFFSVFLPGLAFFLGIYPFFPKQVGITGLGSALIVLTLGFVFGRILHTVVTGLHDLCSDQLSVVNAKTHRDVFCDEVRNPGSISNKLVDGFYREAWRAFGEIGLHYNRAYQDTEEDNKLLNELYVCVRSYTHISSDGPSKKFQAIYAFHHSMWMVSFLLFVAYTTYAFGIFSTQINAFLMWFGVSISVPFLSVAPIEYTPKVSAIGLEQSISTGVLLFLSVSGIITFKRGMARYKDIYTEYIMSDFLSLRGLEDRTR